MAERLIDAEALKHKRVIAIYGNLEQGLEEKEVVYVDDIDNAPTIEAKPVVHAHWECTQWYEYQCSNCGDFALLNDKNIDCKSNYCPHCGAVMDEVTDNDKKRKKT